MVRPLFDGFGIKRRVMVIKKVELETVCGITSTFPKNNRMEVAFAGKSNVGKSSLINAIMNRKSLARTSSQPGKTQTINYYNINDEFYLVDLPGYGYANASVSVKEKWGKMIERYLHMSEMYEWMTSQGYFPIIIATKMDKINRSQLQKHIKMIREGLNAPGETIVIPFSSVTKQGRDEIYALLDDMLASFED